MAPINDFCSKRTELMKCVNPQPLDWLHVERKIQIKKIQ